MLLRQLGLVLVGLGVAGCFLAACSSTSGSSGGIDSGPETSSGGVDSGAETSSGGVDGAGGEAVSCSNYCAKIATRCTGASIQYTDDAQCQKACSFMTAGAFGDTANSIGCRQYHAGNTPAAVHCPHAGPFGGDVCGAHCEAFCELAVSACPTVFTDAAACAAACAGWPRDTTTPVNPTGPQKGNTFDCRAYHLSAALTNPAVHCAHIIDASPVCQ